MILKSRDLQIVISLFFFWLKTENTLWLYAYPKSAPFTIYIYIYIYPQSSASKLISFTRIGSLLWFLLCSVCRRSLSQFQVTILHYPSLNLWYRFGLLTCWFTLFELKILEFRDLLLLLLMLLVRALFVSQIAFYGFVAIQFEIMCLY